MIDAVARESFGVDLRPLQRSAVEATLAGRDTLLLVPTGGGKSLCYQLPALILAQRGHGPTVVVSPLVALIDDQVAKLKSRGIAAVGLHSSQDPTERAESQRAARGAALVYVSPERAVSARFRQWLGAGKVAALAVDEAHCISEWGHDFRPEYAQLGSIRASIGGPAAALTATATPRVRAEISASLGLRDPAILIGDMSRPNLAFAVEHHRGDKVRLARLAAELDARGIGRKPAGGRAIVYASTRARVKQVGDALRKLGFQAGFYHAGRTDGAREKAQQGFADGKHLVLVATTAFGMGIDLPDVRLVVHVQAPGTVEAYYQQAGRAGRDGLPAACLLLYGPSDALVQARLSGGRPGPGWPALQAYVNGATCRQVVFARHFLPDQPAPPCGACDACNSTVQVPERVVARDVPEDDDVDLDADQFQRILDFVGALPKPLGRTLVAAGLRGSRAQKVVKAKLPANPHYAALSDVPERAIVRAIDGLLAAGDLAKKGRKYPTVWIAGKGVRTRSATPRPRPTGVKSALEAWRKSEARRRKWKAYQIFPNSTIAALADRMPGSDDLLDIPGLGEKRVEQFGPAILRILEEYRS